MLGASTSLLTVGTQELDLQQGTGGSAHKRIPVSMQRMVKNVFQTDEDVTFVVTNPDNEVFTTEVHYADGKAVAVSIPVNCLIPQNKTIV